MKFLARVVAPVSILVFIGVPNTLMRGQQAKSSKSNPMPDSSNCNR